MRRVLAYVLAAFAILISGVLIAVTIGRFTFNRSVEREIDDMFQATAAAEPGVLTEADIAHLPEPVQRWLRYSNVIGRERPVAVRLKQEGEIRLGTDQDWMPFTAEQYYTTDPPAFIWKADVSMMPLVSFSGRDKLEDGRGNMNIRVLSLIPVVDATGPEMDQGTLMRYLNEVMWFPAGAVSPYIEWSPVDDNAALARLTVGDLSVEATFFVDDEGRMTNMIGNRYQSSGDEFIWLPWKTPISEYGEFNGVRLPIRGEGVWEEETGDFDYVRILLVDVEYNVPERY